ncbi:hypothetical protein A2U01_0070855, partial [Trifolium medium]|nr:hypothetical protein [Trifolium medium]
MAGVNNNIPEHMAENSLPPEYGPSLQQDGQFALVAEEEQESMDHEPYIPEEP